MKKINVFFILSIMCFVGVFLSSKLADSARGVGYYSSATGWGTLGGNSEAVSLYSTWQTIFLIMGIVWLVVGFVNKSRKK